MSGCFGNSAYDRMLEAEVNRYCSEEYFDEEEYDEDDDDEQLDEAYDDN